MPDLPTLTHCFHKRSRAPAKPARVDNLGGRRMRVSTFLAGFAMAASSFLLPRLAAAAPDNTLGMALMSATVASDGTLVHGSGATGTVKNSGLGDYTVTFERDLVGCSCTASAGHSSIGSPVIAIIATANCPGAAANNLRVVTTTRLDTNTLRLDIDFHAIVFCPK
jgi:hypothetical protein